MHNFQHIILFILIFLIFGCHNASHIRTQKILEEDETSISIGVITNLGGDADAYKYHSIKESNNFGGRLEISYLKGKGKSELGPYAGFGLTTMDFGIIGGFDYRTYSRLYSNNPLKVGGQIEINYTPIGETSGTTIVLRPSITTTTNKKRKYYYGIHGLITKGMNLNHEAYYIDGNLNKEESTIINYDISSVGIGISLGLEKQIFKKYNIQFQLDFSNVRNSFKSSFLYPSGAIPDEDMMSNNVLETGVLDYINSYPFVGLSVGANVFKVKKLSNDRTLSPHPTPEKRRRYDPKTGKEVKKQNKHKGIIYDPETGEVTND
jgi:hypothetical protein